MGLLRCARRGGGGGGSCGALLGLLLLLLLLLLLRRSVSLPVPSPLLQPNFSTALGSADLVRPSQVVEDKLWNKTLINGFGTGAVNRMLVQGQSKVPGLLLTSAAPGVHLRRSFFVFVPSWMKKILLKREVSSDYPLTEDVPRLSASNAHGISFQKCAVLDPQHEPQRAYVKILINNTLSSFAYNVTDLVLLDNVTGLHIQGANITTDGFQKYRKPYLQGGESYSVDYVAVISAKETGNTGVLMLPAKLTFRSPKLNNSELGSLTAPFRIVRDKKTEILVSHGIHALGFFLAFLISFVLSSVVLWAAYNTRRRQRKGQAVGRNPDPAYKVERSCFHSSAANLDDILLNDQIINILLFEEPENMLQSLEDCEITNLTRADSDLEAYRMQICKEGIAMLMKNMVATHRLSPHVEARRSSTLKKCLLALEMEIEEEYKRKMVALTAECSLENRKEAERRQRRPKEAAEDAEELIKQTSEKSGAECRALWEKLHQLQQHHVKQFLRVKQEEYFAKAYRNLAVSQRTEIHNVFFTQIRNMVLKGELKLEAAKSLADDYSKIQGVIEEQMDFLQAHKKYHLSKIFAYREYLIQIIRLLDSQMASIWNSATNQIAVLIRKIERGCNFTENHLGGVLSRAQDELHLAKLKLDHTIKQETQKLYQKLITTRQHEMLRKKDEQKEEMCPGEAFRTMEDICCYLDQWQNILTAQSTALGEQTERLDNEAKEELVALRHHLMAKAAEELRCVQHRSFVQELLKLGVPKLDVQQAAEEHQREMALDIKRLEKENWSKMMAAEQFHQSAGEKLREELLSSIAEQRHLREWEQVVFLKLLGLCFSLSEDELLKIRQEFHSCFSQLDCSLALPKIRARVLLETYQSEEREAALGKVGQSQLTADKLQRFEVKTKTRNKNKIDVLKKSLEEKIHIYQGHGSDELMNKIHKAIDLEREHQLQALENNFGRYITSLQFQRDAKPPQTLELHTALIRLQALLLEELFTSKTLTMSECAEITQRSNCETEELEKKMEDEMLHQELGHQEPYLLNKQRQSPEGPDVAHNIEDENADRRVSAVLSQALNQRKQLVLLHRQSFREVHSNIVVLENILESIEMRVLLALNNKELRQAAYLTKLAMVPVDTLYVILRLLLPMSSQSELLSILGLINAQYSEAMIENDSSGEEVGHRKKRKHQRWWQALETKVRDEVVGATLGRMDFARHNNSAQKQTLIALLEQVKFISPECLPDRLQLDEVDRPAGAADTILLAHTKEKIFVFRDSTPDASSKTKKKISFLNSKKSALTRMVE